MTSLTVKPLCHHLRSRKLNNRSCAPSMMRLLLVPRAAMKMKCAVPPAVCWVASYIAQPILMHAAQDLFKIIYALVTRAMTQRRVAASSCVAIAMTQLAVFLLRPVWQAAMNMRSLLSRHKLHPNHWHNVHPWSMQRSLILYAKSVSARPLAPPNRL